MTRNEAYLTISLPWLFLSVLPCIKPLEMSYFSKLLTKGLIKVLFYNLLKFQYFGEKSGPSKKLQNVLEFLENFCK